MKKIILTILSYVFLVAVHAQESGQAATSTGRTSFYAEVGGPGILFSANIDSRFKKSHLGLGARVGVGFVTESVFDQNTFISRRRSVLTVPVQLNYIFGKLNSVHTFEAGAGVTWASKKIDPFDSFYDEEASNIYATFSFMYRRQPVNGGFTWRIGFTPIVSGEGYVQPSGAAGVGWSF